MIHLFDLQNGRLRYVEVDERAELAGRRPIWIDVVDPSDEESAWLRDQYQIDATPPEDAADIEASARVFEEEDGSLLVRSDFVMGKDEEARVVPVQFIRKGETLISIHDEDLPVIRLLRMRSRSKPRILSGPMDVLVDIFVIDVEYSADVLEAIHGELEKVSDRVLKEQVTDEDAAAILASIAVQESLNGRIRRNLMDTRRALSYLMREELLPQLQIQSVRQVLRDIESLIGHTSFVFDKINFLMDATIGFLNINQNKTIKIFSVVSVGLLPPTLIASIYGMNFRHMPELAWSAGYPFSLALMLASVVAPFLWFRRKGWLK